MVAVAANSRYRFWCYMKLTLKDVGDSELKLKDLVAHDDLKNHLCMVGGNGIIKFRKEHKLRYIKIGKTVFYIRDDIEKNVPLKTKSDYSINLSKLPYPGHLDGATGEELLSNYVDVKTAVAIAGCSRQNIYAKLKRMTNAGDISGVREIKLTLGSDCIVFKPDGLSIFKNGKNRKQEL